MNARAGGAPTPEAAEALTPGWDMAGAVTVAEVMALAFVELGGVWDYQSRPEKVMKTWMAVVARQSLSEIWAELDPRLQALFEDQADGIQELFAEEFLARYPDFADDYNTKHGRPAGEPIDLWNVGFSYAYTGAHIATAGQLFDEILRPAPEGERIGPEGFDMRRPDSCGVSRARGD